MSNLARAAAAILRTKRPLSPEFREQVAQMVEALSACITAMNPPDKGGISMHEWNQRLKAATKQAAAAFDGSDSERHPRGPRCTCKFHPDRDEIIEPDPECGVHGSVKAADENEGKT